MLVTAHDVKEAYERIQECLSNMLVTFRVPDITESAIVEVFPYERDDEELLPPPPSNLKPLSEVKAEQERREAVRQENMAKYADASEEQAGLVEYEDEREEENL